MSVPAAAPLFQMPHFLGEAFGLIAVLIYHLSKHIDNMSVRFSEICILRQYAPLRGGNYIYL